MSAPKTEMNPENLWDIISWDQEKGESSLDRTRVRSPALTKFCYVASQGMDPFGPNEGCGPF